MVNYWYFSVILESLTDFSEIIDDDDEEEWMPPSWPFFSTESDLATPAKPLRPVEYFRGYIDEEIIEKLARAANQRYVVQHGGSLHITNLWSILPKQQ